MEEEEISSKKGGDRKSDPLTPSEVASPMDVKPKRKRRRMVDSDKLALLLWRVILDHGGSCHADTLAEYAFRDWTLLAPSIASLPSSDPKDSLPSTHFPLHSSSQRMYSSLQE